MFLHVCFTISAQCVKELTFFLLLYIVKNETQEWPAESKTPEIQEISPHSQPGNYFSIFVLV